MQASQCCTTNLKLRDFNDFPWHIFAERSINHFYACPMHKGSRLQNGLDHSKDSIGIGPIHIKITIT